MPTIEAEQFPKGAALEVLPGVGNTDADTALTVGKMCEYIRAGCVDSVVHSWARAAAGFRAPNVPNDESLAWGVWWLVKHRVKYVSDDPRLFRLGLGRALDFLIAPAVLVRMAAPKEDCDGFTMLVCSLLCALGFSDVYICTVACDPLDRSRWSHVFPVVRLASGSLVPLDASHGPYPGWAVPPEQSYRVQLWDLNGSKVALAGLLPAGGSNRLQGYRRRGVGMVGGVRRLGLGDDGDDELGGDPGGEGGDWVVNDPFSIDVFGGGASSTTGRGFNWGSFWSNLFGNASSVAKLAVAPSTTYRLPNGTVVTQPYGINSSGSSGRAPAGVGSASILPYLALGAVGLFVIMQVGKKN